MPQTDLIQNSNLSQEQKDFWEASIKNTSDMKKEAYLALFKNLSDDVLWVTESLMEAEKAFEVKDMEKYDKIQKEVEKKLSAILDEK